MSVKGDENECFRVDSGVRQVYHVSLAFIVYMNAGMEVKMSMGRRVEIAWPLVC